MTAPTTAPPAPTVPGPDVTEAATYTLTRRGRDIAADIAVLTAGPFAALAGWGVTGSPVTLVASGVAGAGVAVVVECLRRHV